LTDRIPELGDGTTDGAADTIFDFLVLQAMAQVAKGITGGKFSSTLPFPGERISYG